MSSTHLGFNPDYSEDNPTPDEVGELIGDAILEFGAPWCGHCLTAEPVVENALTDHPNLPHIKLYDGKGKKLGRVFKVKLWPTLILLHNGKEVARLVRPTRASEVRELLAQCE
jgi:thioredoxin 1